ncbi:MAG: DNA replication and repair protein RecF [candidate division WOR-3 bacterium]|nr:DNA replication and repair protein RecF [candidate division WOR-3 bacterium]
MYLEQIRFEGIRNLKDAELVFSPYANYLFGANGAGKTSLLESIHYLAVGRSFRTYRDSEILKFNAEYFKIFGLARLSPEDPQFDSSATFSAEIRFSPQGKVAYRQNHKQDKLSSYLGWLPVVTILLSDIDLVAGSPHLRRNFLDLAISKVNKSYLQHLIEYRRVLAQRNKLLQEQANSLHYEVWESALAKYADLILKVREQVLPQLLNSAQKFLRTFLPNRNINFEYQTTILEQMHRQKEIQKMLAANRVKEQELGYTTIGPHRDDIVIKESNLPIKKFASEGEMRLTALSLKMAEAEFLKTNYCTPLFLLDEVAAELDYNNTKKLLALIAEQGQFFYASAKELKDKTDHSKPGKIFYIDNGEIKKVEDLA